MSAYNIFRALTEVDKDFNDLVRADDNPVTKFTTAEGISETYESLKSSTVDYKDLTPEHFFAICKCILFFKVVITKAWKALAAGRKRIDRFNQIWHVLPAPYSDKVFDLAGGEPDFYFRDNSPSTPDRYLFKSKPTMHFGATSVNNGSGHVRETYPAIDITLKTFPAVYNPVMQTWSCEPSKAVIEIEVIGEPTKVQMLLGAFTQENFLKSMAKIIWED